MVESLSTNKDDDMEVVQACDIQALTTRLESFPVMERGNDVYDVDFNNLVAMETYLQAGGKKEKSKKQYKKYQDMYKTYLCRYRLEPLKQEPLSNFLAVMHHKYAD